MSQNNSYRSAMAWGSLPRASDEERLLHQTDDGDNDSVRETSSIGSSIWLWLSLALNAVLVGVLALGWFHRASTHCRGHCIPNPVYSLPPFLDQSPHHLTLTDALAPADDVISYKTVVFHSGLHFDKTEYQGSSHEVNANWEALYNSKKPLCSRFRHH